MSLPQTVKIWWQGQNFIFCCRSSRCPLNCLCVYSGPYFILQWPSLSLSLSYQFFQWQNLSLSLSYLSCNGHLYLYLYLIYLAMAIFFFIFILFILQWPSLSLSLSDLYCNDHLYIFILFYLLLQAFPLSFQLSGCLQWPSKAPTKKGIAFCPIIYREYFYNPLGKFWREKLVSNICLISRYCLFSFNCHQWHRPESYKFSFPL